MPVCLFHLIENVEQPIMHNGIEILYTAPMKGIHEPVLSCDGAKLGFRILVVFQLKDVLGFPKCRVSG